MTLLFVWTDLFALQLKLMHNALSTDTTKDDLKEMKMEIRTISDMLYVYCDFIGLYQKVK